MLWCVECSRRHLTAVAAKFKKKYSAAGNKGVAGKSGKTADGNKALHSNSREIQTDNKEILWYLTSEYQEAKYRAMIEAVDECIRNNILPDFLIRNKAEVVGMYLTEWGEEAAKKVWRQELFEDGKIEGQDELNELI